ncbi:hypothetical protein DXB92_07690 [Ruminococcus sp. OM06-36AC]|nr:hypothetical protein DXB92_07690 [Ruminococcus sp. OM06-36AC]
MQKTPGTWNENIMYPTQLYYGRFIIAANSFCRGIDKACKAAVKGVVRFKGRADAKPSPYHQIIF